jgi:hypothetical protein
VEKPETPEKTAVNGLSADAEAPSRGSRFYKLKIKKL